MKGTGIYAALCAGVVLIGSWALGFAYTSAADHRAIWLSAAVAFIIQLLAFSVARLMARAGQGIAGWGIGAVISLITLVIWGYASRALGLPSQAAMISLAAFLFVTELIEPPLLNA